MQCRACQSSGIGGGACKCRQPVSGPIAEAIEMRRNGMKEGDANAEYRRRDDGDQPANRKGKKADVRYMSGEAR